MGRRLVIALAVLVAGVGAAASPAWAADGPYAVAAPGLDTSPVEGGEPVLAGRSVVWAATAGGRLAVRRGDPDGRVATIYRPPRWSRRSYVSGLAASDSHVALLRDGIWKRPGCRTRKCARYFEGELLAGPVGGPLKHVRYGTRGFRNRSGCRRGTAFMTDRVVLDPALSMVGSRVLYMERLQCPKQWLKSHYELVLHDLRSGKRRVVHRGDVGSVQLAGRYLAYEARSRQPRVVGSPGGTYAGPSFRLVIEDIRTGKIVYDVPLGHPSEDRQLFGTSLDADGTLAGAYLTGMELDGPLGWFSPAEPRFHQLPQTVSLFSSEALKMAAGRIAFVRDKGGGGFELAVTDLSGVAETYASFARPELLADFVFDGRSLAWVVSRTRPYRGRADRGLPYACDYRGRPRVLAQAPVIEVHPVGQPGRITAARLPSAPVPRDPSLGTPSC